MNVVVAPTDSSKLAQITGRGMIFAFFFQQVVYGNSYRYAK